jgi:hypothetical protein
MYFLEHVLAHADWNHGSKRACGHITIQLLAAHFQLLNLKGRICIGYQLLRGLARALQLRHLLKIQGR